MTASRFTYSPRWVLALLGGLVLFIGGVGSLTFKFMTEQRIDATGTQLATEARDTAETIDRVLFERFGDSQMMADALPNMMYNSVALTNYLHHMKERYLVYDWLSVTDHDGLVVASTDPAQVNEDWHAQPWIRGAYQERDVYIELDPKQPTSETPGLLFATAIRDEQDNILGIITSRMQLTVTREILEALAKSSQEINGEAGITEWQLIDEAHHVIMESLPPGSTLGDHPVLRVESILKGLSDDPGYLQETHQRRQVPVITAYATTIGKGTFTKPHWVLLLRTDQAAVMTTLYGTMWKIAAGALLLLIPSVGFLIWQGRKLQQAWRVNEEQIQSLRLLLKHLGALGFELDSQTLLTKLTETAMQITGATYAALGVFNENGTTLTQFITAGIDDKTKAAVGALPIGRGILGHLVKEPGVLRLKNLAQHDASCGFPPHHPAMASFLGISIRVRGQLLGRLYVTEKKGGKEFTDMDEQTITVLAQQAGDLIERCSLLNQLQHANAQSHLLLESTDQGICGVDAHGICQFINRAGATLLGYTPDELIGQSMHTLCHHSYADGTTYFIEACPILQTLRTGLGCRIEDEVFWRKDRTPIQVNYNAAPLRHENTITGAVVVFSDITERKQAQKRQRIQLAVSQALEEAGPFQETADTILQAICTTAHWDFGATWLLNRSTQSLHCIAFWPNPKLHAPDFISWTQQKDFGLGIGLPGRVWESGHPAWIPDITQDPNFPRRQVAQQASLRAGFAFPLRGREEVLGVMEFFSTESRSVDQDLLVTMTDCGIRIGQHVEYWQAEQDRQQLAHYQRLLMESTQGGIYGVDTDCRCTFINHAGATLLGYTPEALIGQHLHPLIHHTRMDGHPYPATDCPMMQSLLTGNSFHVDNDLFWRKDGTSFSTTFVCSPIKDGTKISGAVVVFNDNTERKRVQDELIEARDQAVAAVRIKSQFLATVSHEIRTPLNGVLGMADLLLSTSLDETQRDFASVIVQSGKSLLTILNDLLDLSKIEAGKLDIKPVEFDPRALITTSLDLFRAQAHVKQITLKGSVHPEVPSAAIGDPDRLSQILNNLVGNAIKFTQAGDVVLRLECAKTDRQALRFEVQDSGIGIAEDAQTHLFQPFSQVDGSSTRKHGGTGLGLAICRQLVHLMGGEIGVTSEPDKGSTFWFMVPSQPLGTGGNLLRPIETDLRGVRVCLAGIHETHRAIFKTYFKRWGVLSAEHNDSARILDLLHDAARRADPFDLVIIGSHLTGTDGLGLAQRVKRAPEFTCLRLTVLDATDHPVDPQHAHHVGIETILRTPIDATQLYFCLAGIAPGATPDAIEPAPPRPRDSQESLIAFDQGTAPPPAPRVLLAEDNPINHKVAVHMLTQLECQVDHVTSGTDALRALSRQAYDLVLMDCQMPEMDGFQATTQFRQQETGERRTPIVAMTANVLRGDREQCLVAGMDDYLPKPITLTSLRAVLQRWLPNRVPSSVQPFICKPNTTDLLTPRRTQDTPTGPPQELPDPLLRLTFDYPKTLARMENDHVLFATVSELFIETTPRLMADIREAMTQQSATLLASHAHKLKGAIMQFCAPDALAAVRSLEMLGKSGELGQVETHWTNLDRALTHLRRALQTVMQEAPPCQ